MFFTIVHCKALTVFCFFLFGLMIFSWKTNQRVQLETFSNRIVTKNCHFDASLLSNQTNSDKVLRATCNLNSDNNCSDFLCKYSGNQLCFENEKLTQSKLKMFNLAYLKSFKAINCSFDFSNLSFVSRVLPIFRKPSFSDELRDFFKILPKQLEIFHFENNRTIKGELIDCSAFLNYLCNLSEVSIDLMSADSLAMLGSLTNVTRITVNCHFLQSLHDSTADSDKEKIKNALAGLKKLTKLQEFRINLPEDYFSIINDVVNELPIFQKLILLNSEIYYKLLEKSNEKHIVIKENFKYSTDLVMAASTLSIALSEESTNIFGNEESKNISCNEKPSEKDVGFCNLKKIDISGTFTPEIFHEMCRFMLLSNSVNSLQIWIQHFSSQNYALLKETILCNETSKHQNLCTFSIHFDFKLQDDGLAEGVIDILDICCNIKILTIAEPTLLLFAEKSSVSQNPSKFNVLVQIFNALISRIDLLSRLEEVRIIGDLTVEQQSLVKQFIEHKNFVVSKETKDSIWARGNHLQFINDDKD